MGLDLVELVIAIEETFEVQIPDAAAAEMRTPRAVIDWLCAHVPGSLDDACLTQRAFYRLRATCARELGLPPRTLTPATVLTEAIPPERRAALWPALRAAVGAERWPALSESPWKARLLGRPTRLGELAHYALTWNPGLLRASGAGWTRAQITETVVRLIERECGVDMTRFTLDSSFTRDLGLD